MYKSILLILLLHYSLWGYSQNNQESYVIKGIIVDVGNNKPLMGANIILKNITDSSLIAKTTSNENGSFEIDVIKADSYLFLVSYTGFMPYHKIIKVNNNINMDSVWMQRKTYILEKVNIKTKRPVIIRTPDKTIVNIKNSIYATGKNAYGLMNIIPEVRADELGNIKFRGEQGVIVYLDGRKIRLTGQELMVLLKNIPSESIKSIEISSIPGAQYEAAGTAAIINIVTKKEYNYGLSGTLSGYYSQHKFPGAGAGLILNYGRRKLNLHGSYNYSLYTFFNNILMKQVYTNTNPPTIFDQKDAYRETYNSHDANIGLDYNLTKRQVIGIVLTPY